MDHAASLHRDAQVLDLWDRAVGLNRWARDDAVLGMQAPRGLGGRNLAFLELRSTVFGPGWPLQSCCPSCGLQVEFAADSAVLRAELGRLARAEVADVDWRGRLVTLKAVTVDDLIAASRSVDAAGAVLARCVSGADGVTLGAAEREELSDLMEQVDPAAAVSFALTCPGCGVAWSAMVDVAEAVWLELRRAAERALVEVDALARAYGWTEAEVIVLTPRRRAAYLQLVQAQ